MKQNVGILDTALRGVAAVICLTIAAQGLLPVTLNLLLVVFGLMLWATASLGVCLIYKILGIDTYPGAGHGLYQHYPKR